MKFSISRPIPPKSVVRYVKKDLEADQPPGLGATYRIGYYSKQGGLDVIWLVDSEGKYDQAIDHEYLYAYYEVSELAEETDDLFGEYQAPLGPIADQ